jgi:hypothetical protein
MLFSVTKRKYFLSRPFNVVGRFAGAEITICCAINIKRMSIRAKSK